MISFVSGGPTGTVLVGIVYDGGKAGSRDEAESLMALVGQGIAVGNIQLKTVLAPVGSLETAEKLDAVFVTSGLTSFDPVYDYTRKHHLVSLTLDDACVAQAKCVMTVKSEPKVEITVSKSAAEASGVVFGSAFRIMIREVQ